MTTVARGITFRTVYSIGAQTGDLIDYDAIKREAEETWPDVERELHEEQPIVIKEPSDTPPGPETTGDPELDEILREANEGL